MTDNVITLKEKCKRLWECSCGCQQWFVHEYGGIECCNCAEINSTITCIQKQVDQEVNDE